MSKPEKTAAAIQFEPRWPVALAILLVLALLAVLPGRIRLFPNWYPYLLGGMVLAPMAAVALSAAKPRWLAAERMSTLLFFVLAEAGILVTLVNLVRAMVQESAGFSGLTLLSSSVAVWVINVFAFSLLYWQIDRGRLEARGPRTDMRPDWLFPQAGLPAGEVRPGCGPTYVDYLYLSFSTGTAFSATDVAPLTSRAKMLMMLESAISLVVIVVVASRAINILG
jgi:uncharacterized membrane protein